MKSNRQYPICALAAMVALAGAASPAWADMDQTTTQETTTTTTTPMASGSYQTLNSNMPDSSAPVTVSGIACGLNLAQSSFWVNGQGQDTPVVADNANYMFEGQTANIYRLMPNPRVTVTGRYESGLFYATQVDVTSGPTVKLERSSYTSMAQPAFMTAQLLPTSSMATTNTYYGQTRHTAIKACAKHKAASTSKNFGRHRHHRHHHRRHRRS